LVNIMNNVLIARAYAPYCMGYEMIN